MKSLVVVLRVSIWWIVVWFFYRWGPQLEQATYKNRQRLYLSEQVSF